MDDKPAVPLLTKEMALDLLAAHKESLETLLHWECEDALDALASGATVCVPAVAAPEGWRPIESAPKGIECLFYHPANLKAWLERAKESARTVDMLTDRFPTGYRCPPESPYTHWMPLPASPAVVLAPPEDEKEPYPSQGFPIPKAPKPEPWK